MIDCVAHRHLPSPLRPKSCPTCHPDDLSEALKTAAMPQTSATVDLLSDIADALRAQVNDERLRVRHLEEQLQRTDDARKNAVAKGRSLQAEVRKLTRQVTELTRMIDGLGGV